jgi:hypothetical protein
MPPFACGPATPPDSTFCDPSTTTADGATGFMDDFESPHAAAKKIALIDAVSKKA